MEAAADAGHGAFTKFPRTQHLVSLGAATRDDLLLDPSERKAFYNPASRHALSLEEKVDGANLGISLDPQLRLRAQNRSHFVNSKSHTQFKALDRWLEQHSAGLSRVLLQNGTLPPGRLLLFGEWLAAVHSIQYARLPDRFMAFDLYDTEAGRFYSRRRFHEALGGSGIATVRALEGYEVPLSEAKVVQLVSTPSKFYDGPIEGVYFRLDEGEWLEKRSKVVRSDFISGDEFWDKGKMRWNQVDHHGDGDT